MVTSARETAALFAGIDLVKLGPPGGYWPNDDACCAAVANDGFYYKIPAYIPLKWARKVKVLVDEKGIHYLWTGWNNGEGHAKAKHDGKTVYIYRFLFQMMTGIVLRRWDYVDHTCEHKACLNYDHWEAVAPRVNTARGPGAATQYRPPADYGEPLDAIG